MAVAGSYYIEGLIQRWLALLLLATTATVVVVSFTPALPITSHSTHRSSIASPLPSSSSSLYSASHRNIIILSHNVSLDVADGYFDVNTLLKGRIDVLARCANSALWISNGIRKGTNVFLMLFPHNITIEVRGEEVRGLNPDERTMALCLQRTLLVGGYNNINSTSPALSSSLDDVGSISDSADADGPSEAVEIAMSVQERRQLELDNLRKKTLKRPATFNPNKPGSYTKSEKKRMRTSRKHREAMIRRIQRTMMSGEEGGATATVPNGFLLHRNDSLEKRLRLLNGDITLMMDEIGEPLIQFLGRCSNSNDVKNRHNTDATTTTTNIILGDQLGYASCDETFLSGWDAVTKVSLGPISLLTSQCITIAHNCLDNQGVITPVTATENCSPAQRRHASLERWLELPASWSDAKKNEKKNEKKNAATQQKQVSSVSYQQQIQTLHPDHPMKLGVTRKQRSSNLINAAETGNTTRLELLLNAGVDVNAIDLYRITSLHYAASHGHLGAVQMLLRFGATSFVCSNDGISSPLRAALANGHTEIFNLIKNHHNGTIPSSESLFSIRSSRMMQTTTDISIHCDHVGAGSFYIDNAFSTGFIERLLILHESLRKNLGQQHDLAMQSTNAARRSHYCDTEGWLCSTLDAALQRRISTQQQPPPKQYVFSHFRFISYHGEDAATSFLAPHIDHPVLDRSRGRTSTHTFILYLTTVDQGGETVLLDHIPAKTNHDCIQHDNEIVRCAVRPVQGRLFVFPHGCPHAGRRVVQGTKIILRGDMIC